jgi:hypothetical protein
MDRADEVIYFVGLPGVPRVILWVKFSPRGGEVHWDNGRLIPARCSDFSTGA